MTKLSREKLLQFIGFTLGTLLLAKSEIKQLRVSKNNSENFHGTLKIHENHPSKVLLFMVYY